MTRAWNHAASDQAGQLRAFVRIFSRRPADAVIRAIQCDDRRIDPGTVGKPPLHLLKTGLARGIPKAVTVGMNHDVDKVRVIK
jgi:hypothetical protein